MCKKIGLAAVLVVAGLVLLRWTGLSSYTSTAWGKIRGAAKNQVPLEFEIDRVRHEVSQLIPEMKKNLGVIAAEMVAVENLREEIAVTRANLKDQEKHIRTLTKELQNGAERVVYKGREMTASRASERLDRDFASFKRCEAEVKSKEQLLDAKEHSVEAAREQLSSMRNQKRDLEVQIAQLEAEVKTLRLAQTRDRFHFDDSKLAQCKAALAEIHNRLKVERTVVEMSGQFAEDYLPPEQKAKSPRELSKEINAYFNEGAKEDAKLAERK